VTLYIEYIKPLLIFRRSWWLIIDINSVLVLLHRVEVGDVADVLETHAASIIRVDPEDDPGSPEEGNVGNIIHSE
jgi:hypothetical protein